VGGVTGYIGGVSGAWRKGSERFRFKNNITKTQIQVVYIVTIYHRYRSFPTRDDDNNDCVLIIMKCFTFSSS